MECPARGSQGGWPVIETGGREGATGEADWVFEAERRDELDGFVEQCARSLRVVRRERLRESDEVADDGGRHAGLAGEREALGRELLRGGRVQPAEGVGGDAEEQCGYGREVVGAGVAGCIQVMVGRFTLRAGVEATLARRIDADMARWESGRAPRRCSAARACSHSSSARWIVAPHMACEPASMSATAAPGWSAAPGSASTISASKKITSLTCKKESGRLQRSRMARLDVFGVERERHRREQVVVVAGEAVAPLDLSRPVAVTPHNPGELGVVVTVTGPQPVGVAGLGEVFFAVLADRLQQPIPGVEPGVVDDRPTNGPPGSRATRTRRRPRSDHPRTRPRRHRA